jgi:hypothetical protein
MRTDEEQIVAYAPAVPVVKVSAHPVQLIGDFISRLVAAAVMAVVGATVVTVALLLAVVLAPVLLVAAFAAMRRYDQLRLSRAAV